MSKPSITVITVARKPLSEGSVAENVLRWDCGGLNIDGARIEVEGLEQGRWPSNVVLNRYDPEPGLGCPSNALDEQSGTLVSNSGKSFKRHNPTGNGHTHGHMNPVDSGGYYGDEGGASRYFKQVASDE